MDTINHTPADGLDLSATGFATVAVGESFARHLYPPVFQALQEGSISKLFDLSAMGTVQVELFEELARAWRAPACAAPRLGILLSFPHWMRLSDLAVAALQPLVDLGVQIETFYPALADGLGLERWLRHGESAHPVSAVIRALRTKWRSSLTRLHTLESMLQHMARCASASESSVTAAALMAIVLVSDGNPLAWAILEELPAEPSPAQGAVMCAFAKELAGQALLEQAPTVLHGTVGIAAGISDSDLGATAFILGGLRKLHCREPARAESMFRNALQMLSTQPRAKLQMFAYQGLVEALSRQGKAKAESHLREASLLHTQLSFAKEDDTIFTRFQQWLAEHD